MKKLVILLSVVLMNTLQAGTCWQTGVKQEHALRLFDLDHQSFTVRSFAALGIKESEISRVRDAEGEVLFHSCRTDHDVKSCLLALNFAHADYSYYAYDINLQAKLDLVNKTKTTKVYKGKMFVELLGDFDSYYYGPEFHTLEIVCQFKKLPEY